MAKDLFEEKEWYKEGCTCPKMDNDDMGVHYYFTVGCPLHTSESMKDAVKRGLENESR